MIPLSRIRLDLWAHYAFFAMLFVLYVLRVDTMLVKWLFSLFLVFQAASAITYWLNYNYVQMKNWGIFLLFLGIGTPFSFPLSLGYIGFFLFHNYIFQIYRIVLRRPRSFWDLID